MDKVKKLEEKAEELWKEICFLRDGRHCQVQINFPQLYITHSGPLQVDHCISRANKHFFFDIRNGTVVCASCNGAKHFKTKSVDRAIEQIVREREGSEWLDKAIAVDMSCSPCEGWKKVWWLEKVIRKLKRQRKKYLPLPQ